MLHVYAPSDSALDRLRFETGLGDDPIHPSSPLAKHIVLSALSTSSCETEEDDGATVATFNPNFDLNCQSQYN